MQFFFNLAGKFSMNRLVLLSILVSLLFLTGCPKKDPVPGTNQIETALNEKAPIANMSELRTNAKTEIYIQKSASMKGYTVYDNSDYIQCLNTLKFSPSLLDSDCYAYGSHIMKSRDFGIDELKNPTFYQSVSRNVLSNLLTRISARDPGSATISANNIRDWAALMSSLKQRVDPHMAQVWEYLDENSKKIISNWQVGVTIEPEMQRTLLNGLNGVLGEGDFFDKDAFGSLGLRKEGQKLLKKGINNLDNQEIMTLNRLVIDACFPIAISKCKSSELPETMLILTTGVNNVAGYTKEEESMKAIRNLIDKGYYFDIIVVESQYIGPIWSIRKGQKTGKSGLIGKDLNKDGKISLGENPNKYNYKEAFKYQGTRPFCMFIFSKDKNKGEKLFEEISERVGKAKRIHFPAEPRCLSIKNLPIYKGGVHLYDPTHLKDGFVYVTHKRSKNSDENKSELFIETDRPADQEVDVNCHIIGLKGKDLPESFEKGLQVTTYPTKQGKLGIALQLNAVPPEGWRTACRIDLVRKLPKWISGYSTEDDSKKKSFDKIYLLENMLDTIRNKLSDYPDGYIYIIIRG